MNFSYLNRGESNKSTKDFMRKKVIYILALFLTVPTLFGLLAFTEKGKETDWSKKHIAILGDSNTWLGGDECDKPKGWNKWFKETLKPASCKSYARSGATWTNTLNTIRNISDYSERLSDNNVIYNQIERLHNAVETGTQSVPDIVIIAAGTNDAWFQAKRPQAFAETSKEVFAISETDLLQRKPYEVLSVAASVRYSCLLVKKYFPKSVIILLTPMQTTATSLQNITKTGNIIEECARKMNVLVIRQDKISCVKRSIELRRKTYTADGTHTNSKGAHKNGVMLAQEIKNHTLK